MALGPIAKVVAQATLMGLSILARAIPAAYGAALQNAKKGGVDAAKASEGVFTKKRIQLDEALMIMNLEKGDVTPEIVQKVRFRKRYVCVNVGKYMTQGWDGEEECNLSLQETKFESRLTHLAHPFHFYFGISISIAI